MYRRTDLAIDLGADCTEGLKKQSFNTGGISITEIEITNKSVSEHFGKPIGKYTTLEFPSPEKIADTASLKTEIAACLCRLLPKDAESFLIVGLGNPEITSDNIGPAAAARILATRHLMGEIAESLGFKELRSVSVITPNVLGKTGIETAELVKGIVEKVQPQAVIALDALASSSAFRLFRTVQLTNTGISPGSGVKNERKELSERTLGVPVIAVGVPTVMQAQNLINEFSAKPLTDEIDMLVTPKDSDLLCQKISDILSCALNMALQPEIDADVLSGLV